jgi:hypothetical protein
MSAPLAVPSLRIDGVAVDPSNDRPTASSCGGRVRLELTELALQAVHRRGAVPPEEDQDEA